jgi:cobalt/nickel transport system permease protein
MVIPHALVASVVEGLLTALVIAYLQRSNISVLEGAQKSSAVTEAGSMQRLRWLWAGLVVLIVASPLGLLAPGTAWGEWGTRQLKERGFQAVPAGLEKLSGLWGAPLAGYNLSALGNANMGYLLSAVLGIAIIAFVVWLFTSLVTANSQKDTST